MKVFPAPIRPSPRFTPVQSFGFLDVPRSDSLWNLVYVAPKPFIRKGQWVDRASSDIALRYVITGVVLADAMRFRGDSAEAAKLYSTADAMARAAGLQNVLAPARESGPAPGGDTAR